MRRHKIDSVPVVLALTVWFWKGEKGKLTNYAKCYERNKQDAEIQDEVGGRWILPLSFR